VTLCTEWHLDYYRRLVGDLRLDGRNPADDLIAWQLARRYTGGRRKPWCTDRTE